MTIHHLVVPTCCLYLITQRTMANIDTIDLYNYWIIRLKKINTGNITLIQFFGRYFITYTQFEVISMDTPKPSLSCFVLFLLYNIYYLLY